MATKTKPPTRAEFAKMSKAEQQKWLEWEDRYLKNMPIVDPYPAVKPKKSTKKK